MMAEFEKLSWSFKGDIYNNNDDNDNGIIMLITMVMVLWKW